MHVKAFIWDLDGTLLDSYHVIVSSLTEAYRTFGIVPNPVEVNEYIIKQSVSAYVKNAEKQTGIVASAVYAKYLEISEGRKGDITQMPYATETLQRLRERGATNYVFTHRGVTTEFVLKNIGIYDFFDEIVTSLRGFPRKPAPDALLYLVKKYSLDPDNTYYVGDRILDMDCAKSANIHGILYQPQGSFCEANGSESCIIHDLREILLL